MCIVLTYLGGQLTGVPIEEIEALKKSPDKNAMVEVHFDPAKLASETQIMDEVCNLLSKYFGCEVKNDGVVAGWSSVTIPDSSTESGLSGAKDIMFQIYW